MGTSMPFEEFSSGVSMLQRFGANYTVRLVPSQEMAQVEMPT